jgi:hypothetical protein
MKWLHLTLAASVVMGACGENPSAPSRQALPSASMAKGIGGTGLGVDIVPTVKLPFGLGGSITFNHAVVTNFALVENTVGEIVGLDVTGTLTGTEVDAVGKLIGVGTSPFTAEASITSSGPGQCSLVSLDLTGLNADLLGIVDATVPLSINAKGSGAVGSLLCNLGQALGGLGSLLGGGTGGAQGLVNALNNQVGG